MERRGIIEFNRDSIVFRYTDNGRRNYMTETELNRLTTLEFGGEELIVHGDCAICREEITNKQLNRILPCNHRFHTDCVDIWLLRSSRSCPYCTQSIL